MPKTTSPQHRLLELLGEVLAIARTLAVPTTAPRTTGAAGIYPHQSKYNPWRAYVWDTKLRKSVYRGAFSSKAKAAAAQKTYRTGGLTKSGTKAALRVVQKVAA